MARSAVSFLIGLVFALIAPAAFAHDSGFGLARYTSGGRLDTTFGNGGVVVTRSAPGSFVANALALQSDGKIVIGGMISDVSSGTLQLAVARYNADGTPDATFGTSGISSTPVGVAGGEANAIAIQPDGMIVVAGTAFSHGSAQDSALLARYTSTGALDTSFGAAGITTTALGAGASNAAAVVLQNDFRIVVVGTAYSNGPTDDDFAVARYTATGHLDQSFGNGGIITADFGSPNSHASLDRATSVALQPDGKVLVGGFTRGDHQAFAVVRYTSDGNLDTSFGAGGKAQIPAAEPQVYAIMLQNSGDIVLAGSTTTLNGTAPFALLRLLPDGTPDELFGTAGLVSTAFDGSRSGARTVVAQSDGKLISGGAKFGAPSAQGDALPQSGFALARYKADGSLDPTFGSDGRTSTDLGDAGATPLSLAVQPDGKILVAGLVFFQVATPTSSAGFPLVPVIVGALAVVLLAIAAMRLSRRSPAR